MNWFKVTIKLKSPTGTPWQADTLFGHLCWVLAHRDGEAALKRFLQPFLDGKPTFLISDGFPAGLLPRPLTFRLPGDDTLEQFQKNRKLRKLTFLREEEFHRALQGNAFEPEDYREETQRRTVSRAVLKAQISRVTGTTGMEGNLFGFKEYWMPQVIVYGKAREDSEELVRGLFQAFRHSGYGKRKTVGYGAVDNLDFSRFSGFPHVADANGFIALSAFVPSPGDPTQGRWRLRVKYGRLGEDFAFGGNPFKKPMVMLEPGAVFYDAPVKEYYGRMVEDVSAVHPEVVHYGYALPVPAKLPVGVNM